MQRYVSTVYDAEGRHVVKDTETGQVVSSPLSNMETADKVAAAMNTLEEQSEEGAYSADDPKHSGFRERLASLWDSRPGK